MYDPDEEVRNALRQCLRMAYTRQTETPAVPEPMQALLSRLAERQSENRNRS